MNANTLTTGTVRLSYAHLFTPYAGQGGGEPKYSTTVLVPKSDVDTKRRIDEALNAAMQTGISEKWGGQRPPALNVPVHDGDGVRPSDGMPYGPECRGHWVFNAGSRQPVSVVDQAVQPILNQSEVYSGMYARVNVTFFAYNSNGRKGIGCGLNAVQKVSDGEPLGGGVSAEEAFGGANAAPGGFPPPAPQASYGQVPAPAFQQPVQPGGYAPVQPTQTPPQYAPAPIPQPQQIPQPAPQTPAPQPQPAQPQAPQQPPAVDPITGLPAGGVMGI